MGRRTASERSRPPHRAWTHAAACLFSAARQLDSTRIRRIGLLCTPRAPARPTRARAGPDGRADSTALRSATRALPPCAAGLMHSTRAHGAGIAAIAAIRQSPRDGNERADDGLQSIISIGSKNPELYYSTLYGKEMAREAVNTRSNYSWSGSWSSSLVLRS
jgi:hypothetical protein